VKEAEVRYLPLSPDERQTMTSAAYLMRLVSDERTRDLAHAIGTYEATVQVVEEQNTLLGQCLELARIVLGSINAQALDDLEAGWSRLLSGESDIETEMEP
jgi:hypothetical protein